jgi:hypothetical protein
LSLYAYQDAELLNYHIQCNYNRRRLFTAYHRSLSVNAKKEGISMNQYCIYLLSKNDAAYQTAAHV